MAVDFDSLVFFGGLGPDRDIFNFDGVSGRRDGGRLILGSSARETMVVSFVFADAGAGAGACCG